MRVHTHTNKQTPERKKIDTKAKNKNLFQQVFDE